jgi:hypothetical protein
MFYESGIHSCSETGLAATAKPARSKETSSRGGISTAGSYSNRYRAIYINPASAYRCDYNDESNIPLT